jgi:hypothetical protein
MGFPQPCIQMVTKGSSSGVVYIKGCSTRRFVFAVLHGNALEPVLFLSDSIFFFFFLNPYIIHFLKLELFALIDPTILKIKKTTLLYSNLIYDMFNYYFKF